MLRQLSYLKAIVIVHGKSEKQMCDFIKSNLRLRIEIASNQNGAKPIQINGLINYLNSRQFKTFKAFSTEFAHAEFVKEKTKIKLADDFKIFIIMDTDDCTDAQKSDFLSKNMFKEHWLYPYIHPIHNSPNLEDVLTAAGIPFTKKGDERKQEYIRIFPTDPKYKTSDALQVEDFHSSLKQCRNSNLHEFTEFCLQQIKSK